jgi:hypothetical protein
MTDLFPLIGAYGLGIATGILFMLWREYRKSVAMETVMPAHRHFWTAPSHDGSRLKTAMANADVPKPRKPTKKPAAKPRAKPAAKGMAK